VKAAVAEALSFKSQPRPQGANGEDDESIHSLVTRRFGQEFADNLFDPMCHGIYAGDVKQLSVRSCFPSLYWAERDHGSILRGLFLPAKSPTANSEQFLDLQLEQDPKALNFVETMRKHAMWSFKGGLQVVGALTFLFFSFVLHLLFKLSPSSRIHL